MERSEVSTSVLKCSVGVSNNVPTIITRYKDQIKFATYMAVWFVTFRHILWFQLYRSVYGCGFFMFLFNYVNCVVLLLCLCIPIVM